MNKVQVTYRIRNEETAPSINQFFIDQLADDELDRSYGPYWSRAIAEAQIKNWEADERR